MAKTQTKFVCQSCGSESPKWVGRCPDCGSWNSFRSQTETKSKKTSSQTLRLISLEKQKTTQKQRLVTSVYEFDRVLGGGFIPGSVILLTGEPGVGKSTLLLQMLANLSTLYISGEESIDQINDRIDRLKLNRSHLFFSDTQDIDVVINGIETNKDIDLVVIDSIQTFYSSSIDSPLGSVNQLKVVVSKLISFAKKRKIPVIIIGHVTKEGDIAGPKALEHLVDVVLTFEGEKISEYRILRSTKNRFGPTDEIGVFTMTSTGLKPTSSSINFVRDIASSPPGVALVGVIEGKRPFFFEIQTLVSPTILPVPRRVVKGFDYNKTLLLLAVTRKFLSLPFDRFDIYVNVVGGVSIKSPAADLVVIASLISSFKNRPIKSKSLFIGEVGLSGEVRLVPFADKIINEAKRLGYKYIYDARVIQSINALKTLF